MKRQATSAIRFRGAVQAAADSERLNALRDNAWELRPYVMLGGAVGWCVIRRGPDGFTPMVVADAGSRDPRHAIDAALAIGAGKI